VRTIRCTPTSLLIFPCSVNLTDDGKAAVLKLSKGDMRRALNVLQACHAAYERIGETEIYTCTGSPHPSDIEAIVNSMLTDEFTTSHQSEHSHVDHCISLMIGESDYCAQD
jgi:DNA polymerase III delta prime subunit